jgi:hypothetical protein
MAELILFPSDRSLRAHDERAAAVLLERVLEFLDSRGGGL